MRDADIYAQGPPQYSLGDNAAVAFMNRESSPQHVIGQFFMLFNRSHFNECAALFSAASELEFCIEDATHRRTTQELRSVLLDLRRSLPKSHRVFHECVVEPHLDAKHSTVATVDWSCGEYEGECTVRFELDDYGRYKINRMNVSGGNVVAKALAVEKGDLKVPELLSEIKELVSMASARLASLGALAGEIKVPPPVPARPSGLAAGKAGAGAGSGVERKTPATSTSGDRPRAVHTTQRRIRRGQAAAAVFGQSRCACRAVHRLVRRRRRNEPGRDAGRVRAARTAVRGPELPQHGARVGAAGAERTATLRRHRPRPRGQRGRAQM